MTLNLHEKALFCVKNYKSSEKELILVLEEIDRDKTYLAFGKSSLWKYCVEVLGLTESETYRFIEVTRKSALIPEFKEAIQTGSLSVGKGARIASVLTPANQENWIELAKTMTHREIEREISKENPKAIPKERIKVLTDTRVELKFSVSVEVESKFKRAFQISQGKSMEETLEALTDFYLKHKDKLAKAERIKAKPKSTLHVQSKKTQTRTIPKAVLHEVYLRDKGKCTFKGCGETKYVQIHHIILVSRGGTHTLSNLTTLCSAHHKMLHEQLNSIPAEVYT